MSLLMRCCLITALVIGVSPRLAAEEGMKDATMKQVVTCPEGEVFDEATGMCKIKSDVKKEGSVQSEVKTENTTHSKTDMHESK